MSLIKTKPQKDQSIMDKLNENSDFKKMQDLQGILSSMNTDIGDSFEEGYGEFGWDVTNPVPTNSPFGSISYLAKLRDINGRKPSYERIGSYTADNIDQMIDGYELKYNGGNSKTIYICPYGKENSKRPPSGFSLSYK